VASGVREATVDFAGLVDEIAGTRMDVGSVSIFQPLCPRW